MYRGSEVDAYTRVQNLTSEPKARTASEAAWPPRYMWYFISNKEDKARIRLPRSGSQITLKVMRHTDVVAPIVTNRFPYFRRTSSFFDSKESGLL